MITPLILKTQPGTAIGLVIELGDEHLVALVQGAGDGAAQGIIERGHVLTERDAARSLGAQEGREDRRAPPSMRRSTSCDGENLPCVLTLQVA